MRRLAALGCALLALIICLGCWVNSLHSIYNQGDLMYDKALVGTWEKAEGSQERWKLEISQGPVMDGPTYDMVFSSEKCKDDTKPCEPEGKPLHWQGRLARIGDNLFLEVTTREDSPDELHLVAAHSFYKINLQPSVFRATFMDDEWLRNRLTDKKISIAHYATGGGLAGDIVLTAETEDVRKLLLQYGSDSEAFPEGNEMVWKKK